MSKATSIAAYRTLSQSGYFSDVQNLILDAVDKHGPLTRKELVAATNRPINSLCNAALRLVEAGTLIEVDSMNEDTGRKASKLMRPHNAKPQNPPSALNRVTKTLDPMVSIPTTKELLCSSILASQFTKQQTSYTTEVVVKNVIYLVEVTPQARKGN